MIFVLFLNFGIGVLFLILDTTFIVAYFKINAAGYGDEAGYKGGKMKIMYQSVRQKGTPILRPTPALRPTPPLKTLLPRHGGRIMNPQDPSVLNDPNHIQNPRRGIPLNQPEFKKIKFSKLFFRKYKTNEIAR